MLRKLLIMGALFAAFIIFQSTEAKAQRLPIYFEVFKRVFEPTPLNKGERDYEKQPLTKAEIEKNNREIEKSNREVRGREQREQKERKETPSRREPDRDCTTRGGRRDIY